MSTAAPIVPSVAAVSSAEASETPSPPSRSAAARSLMDRMQRLADRRVAQAQCPIPLPPAPEVATKGAPPAPPLGSVGRAGRRQRSAPPRDLNAAETPAQRDQAFAAKLASILDDPESLGYYEHLARRSREGKLLPRRTHLERRDLLLTKARQIASRKAPHGPIRNPAACFVSWVKGLG